MNSSIIQDLLDRGIVTIEELPLIDNLDERLAKIAELNRKTDEFLKNATDDDFKKMFGECEIYKPCNY